MEKILIAVDLEGVNKVVGYPYKGLGDGEEYEIAKSEAVNEINIIVKNFLNKALKRLPCGIITAGATILTLKR